jgi:starch-binding outer membrane protein, SusD/RagB family
MKFNKIILSTILSGLILFSCSKKVLDDRPLGQLDLEAISNKDGVESLLIGAYSLLDGVGSPNTANYNYWESAGSNWVYGSICGTEAHKGSYSADQGDLQSVERFVITSYNESMGSKWGTVYDGVQRCNDVLRVMRTVAGLNPKDTTEIRAEALFLRAHYHFEAKKMWNHVPFVDESITYDAGNYYLSNEEDIWPRIEDDLKYAVTNLPPVQSEIGRANHYSAEALLAKAYLFQNKYDSAKILLDEIIGSGVYHLATHFHDNFDAATQNYSEEYIFAAQTSVNDGSAGLNGNYGDIFNYAGGLCCGFFQPSQFLVNHFKTDPITGLPNLDEDNLTNIKSDNGLSSEDPFSPDTASVDPRLDWTVGRRGIPYLDWGLHPGSFWIIDQSSGGPYSPIKNMYLKSQVGTLSDVSGWDAASNANNINLIRYADVLLWAAEAEVLSKNGSLAKAQQYVNEIRMRAADPTGWVYKYKNDQDPSQGYSDTPAAHYFIKPYPGVWTDPVFAMNAIRYERMLELGMEGHRFFDLVRWGIAAKVINAYLVKEKNICGYLAGSVFVAGKNEYYPIPQSEIDKSKNQLKQNNGY